MKKCFMDLDDTLIGYQVDGQVVSISTGYRICVKNLCSRLAEYGFRDNEIQKAHNEIYKKLVTCRGFGSIDTFPHSFGRTYEFISERYGQKADPNVIRQVEILGRQVFEFQVVPLPGALEALEEMAAKFHITIVTKGAPDYQVKKANDSGCLQIASSLVVMSTKSVEEWREKVVTLFLSESEISEAWVVGDSIKSDINPALHLGLNAVHVKSPDVWDFEEVQLGTLNNGQLFYTVDTIGDAPQYLK